MKTIANCSPREFLVQTNKIRHHVEKWLRVTDVMHIRKRMPTFEEGMSDEEITAETRRQARQNISDMLDAALGEHPQETAELLGLMCFIEPQDIEKHRMLEFLAPVMELINDKEVIDFFISLARLAEINTSEGAKA